MNNKFVVYDNNGETLDRYTVICLKTGRIKKNRGRILYEALSASENGLGVFMWVECIRGSHLGSKIPFESLDVELQNKIKLAYH